ncbi:N-acetyltransferase [Rhizobium sp. SSA_523]|uniref:GNAT family N-acetyltransferase n=1 Tax=Rhizobium sp. SSA_523 TaxID=2952477 RepID=UPI002090DC02|nr:GNAT family N-acetyltransferase [Rhizobium sp. SSA_523]MCO5732381.1 GNAT family N-acetyltransferase [Rhizobium sp. SSA_523]WKC21224.1 GNAT family N-acetyltransferase [Rhizobium sp. SSA_523]
MKHKIEVTANASAEEIARIGENLTGFNEGDVGPSNRLPLTVLVRNETGELVAGINGHTAWGWLYIQWLWVAEDQRGRGLAGQMLTAAEAEARSRDCHSAWIDTFNPVAEKAYRRHGFEVFGELPDFPLGRTRRFLKKKL